MAKALIKQKLLCPSLEDASTIASAENGNPPESFVESKTEKNQQRRPLSPMSSIDFPSSHHISHVVGLYLGQDQLLDRDADCVYLQCLSHAQLYVFADQKQVSNLKTLAAERLEKTIQHFQHYTDQAGDITFLVEYVYGSTAGLMLEDDKLRQVVVKSNIEHLEDLVRAPVFMKLLENGGRFVQSCLEDGNRNS